MASDQSMAIGCQPTRDLQFYCTFGAFEDHEIDDRLNEEEDENTNALEPFRSIYLFFVRILVSISVRILLLSYFYQH